MENEQKSENSIALLPLSGIPQEILDLGVRMANTKYQIDLLGKSGWGNLTANLHGLETSGEWDGPDDALTFLGKIFPFAQLPGESEALGVFQVPTERVIGRSWRWWPEHLSHNSEAKLREHLSGPGAAETTSYYFVQALGLVLAAEGQNRVSYCRERRIPTITARVSLLSYPPSDRLRIYHVNRGTQRQSWVVYHDRYLQPVQWPRITLPALSTYGVRIQSWPLTQPPVERVFEELYHLKQAENFVAPCLDLHALKQKIEDEAAAARLAAKPVKMALAEMQIANIWPLTLSTLFCFMLSLIVAGFTLGAGILGKLSLFTGGGSASVLLFLLAPVLMVSRRMRKPPALPVEEESAEAAEGEQPQPEQP